MQQLLLAMDMEVIIVSVFLLFQILSVSGSSDGQFVWVGDSPVTCSSEGVECERIGNNLIDAVTHVLTLEECRQICLDDENCDFISYFDDSATPVSHLCQMFITCENTINCSNCVSENMACYRSCSSNVVGDLDENIQDLLTNIESELACRQLCLNVSECSFYTYFYPNDTNFEKYCFLQTEFVGPAQPCSTCITGPVDCSVKCSLALDGVEHTSLMLNNTDKSNNITITGWGSCDLTLLLVGGGGRYGSSGGAGSGYLQYSSLQVSPGTVLTAQVGDQRQSSSVTLSSSDTVTAQPGKDSHGSYDGGDGYCGGGGGGGFDGGAGGTNGGDGHSGSGGSGGLGTGEDVSSFTFTAWNIEAGAGGEVYDYNPGGGHIYFGGGGGGLLVDGQGPKYTRYQGQGYGGGGCGLSSYGAGLPGVILIEMN